MKNGTIRGRMRLKAELKVPGGKLIRVESRVDDGTISYIRITGDFFLHPEEGLEILESRLEGVKAEEGEVREAVLSFFNEGYTLIGAEPENFVEAIRKTFR